VSIGMNLVAKEFVACQINQPPGVLIVSPFAGAGETMHEALICNPYEINEAAEVLHRFVNKCPHVRNKTHETIMHLYNTTVEKTVYFWVTSTDYFICEIICSLCFILDCYYLTVFRDETPCNLADRYQNFE
jgi:trehalose-6-phosphate synthase